MNTNSNPETKQIPKGATAPGGVADAAGDILTLLELQAKLLAVDAKETTRGAIAPLAALALSVALLFGCFPLVLLGLAHLLIQFADWEPAGAYFTAAGAGALFAALVATLAALALRTCTQTFNRSKTQAVRNFQWIKAAFAGSKRAY